MVLYLPGYSIANNLELESFELALKSNGFEILAHKWSHWLNQDTKWDVNAEIEIIKQELGANNVDFVVAKSMGTYVAASMIWQKTLDPKKVVFMGIPLNDLSADEDEFLGLALRRMQGKLTLVHNTNDPHGSLQDLNSLVLDIQHDLIIKESDTHEYNYPEDVLKVLKS